MLTSQMIFIGIKGSVIALDRITGHQIWATHLRGCNFVNVVVDKDLILAACDGEIFCLDPVGGVARWHNPLKGYGLGLVTIATEANPASGAAQLAAEMHHREQQAAASSAAPLAT